MNNVPATRGSRQRDPAFAAAWTLLRNAFPPHDSVNAAEQFGAYKIVLEDVDSADVLEAAKRIARREHRMPAPAAIREEVAQIRADRQRAKDPAGKPSPGKTQAEILRTARELVARTMSANTDHVDRLIAKCDGRLSEHEVRWRIRYVLEAPAYNCAVQAILGREALPDTLTFEVYNPRILENLASWARLPVGAVRVGHLTAPPPVFARPPTPQSVTPEPTRDTPEA